MSAQPPPTPRPQPLALDNSPSVKDYYALLGLANKNATMTEITDAIAAHSCEEKRGDFTLYNPIEQAETILLDPTKRTLYNAAYEAIRRVHDNHQAGIDQTGADTLLAAWVNDVRKGHVTEVPQRSDSEVGRLIAEGD